MSVSQSNRNPVGNKLLASLSREEYHRLLPHLELVSLSSEQVLYEVNQPIEYAYFPLTAIVSVLSLVFFLPCTLPPAPCLSQYKGGSQPGFGIIPQLVR
jgi:hypothetical protein